MHSAMKKWAEELRPIAQAAREIGVNANSLQHMINQFEEVGVSAETTRAGVQKMSEAVADLQRQGSRVAQSLREAAGNDPERQRNMDRFIDKLKNAKTAEEQYNIASRARQSIIDEGLKRGRSLAEVTDAANRALPFLDPRLAAARKSVEVMSEAERRAQEERLRNGEELANKWSAIKSEISEIQKILMTPFFGTVLRDAEAMLRVVTAIRETLQRIRDLQLLRPDKAKESIQDKLDQFRPIPGLPSLIPRSPEGQRQFEQQRKLDEQKKSTDENTDATKKQTDSTRDFIEALKTMGQIGYRGGGGGFDPSMVRQASLTTGGGYGPFGPGGAAASPYGSSVGAGTGAGAGSTPASGGGGGGTPNVHGPMKLGKGDDPRGLEQYIREAAKREGVDPDTAVRVAKSEGLRDFLGDRGKSGGAFQLYTGGGLGNEFQKETGLNPLDPKNEKATIDWAMKKVPKTGWGPWHGAKAVGVGPREGLPGGTPPTASAMPDTGTDAGGTLHGYTRRKGEPGEFNYAATGAYGPPGQNQTTITLKNGKSVQVNAALANQYQGFLNTLIDRGYNIDSVGGYNYRSKRGGGGLSMHAYGAAVDINPGRNPMGGRATDMPADVEKLAWGHGLSWGGRFGDPMHFEPMSPRLAAARKQILEVEAARKGLAAAQANEVNVNGSGKIQVNVNAPKGTHVSAEASGLFKSTEVNRQTQMEPARKSTGVDQAGDEVQRP
jgi:D-alanyl-D-alanine carboxypeptidase